MAESFRFRNDSAISFMPALCTYERPEKLRDLADVTIHIEPGAAHLLKARQLMHATLHPLLRRNTRHRTVIRNELHRTGRIKRATRRSQNIQAIPTDIILQLQGGRASTRMPARQQVRRIPSRKRGKTRAHQLLRRGSSQRAGGSKLAQEPAAASAVHLTARAGAAVIMVKFNLVQFSHANQYKESTARRNARSAGDTNPPAERAFLFSIVKFERTYTVRISGNAYSAIARAGVSAAEGLPTYAPRYLAAGWESATLVWPLPKMFSRRVLPSYSVR